MHKPTPEQVAETTFCDGNWFRFSKCLLTVLTIEECVMYCYLFNIKNLIPKDKLEQNKGWFFRHHRDIMKELRISRRKQTRLIGRLKEKEFLKIKQKGYPSRRWLKVRTSALLNAIYLFQNGSKDCVDKSGHTKVDKSGHTKVDKSGHTSIKNKYIKHNKSEVSLEIELCKLLKESLKNTRMYGHWTTANQAKELAKFRRIIKDDSYLVKVFKWYCQNLHRVVPKDSLREDGIYMAKCDSPSSIIKNWTWISNRYDQLNRPEDNIEVTKEATDIAKRLGGKYWPKGSEDQLDQAVQLSITEYDKFRKNLKKLKVNGHVGDFVEYLRNRLPRSEDFVEGWFREVNDSVANWKDWHGNILKESFSVKSKRFQQHGKDLATRYGRSPKLWNELMEVIK